MREAHGRLPSVDKVLSAPATLRLVERFGRANVRDSIRALQQELRGADGLPAWATDANGYAPALGPRLEMRLGRGPIAVFNLTGTLIHTNLGRATVGEATAAAGLAAATSPVALEYDLEAGERGDRDTHLEPLLKALTGADAVTVVNNNAAALVLVLNTLALGRGVLVSRGELIEIGGSFRLPEMMAQSGCLLREVGTTNRTHPQDYADAASDAALLLKVHPSNYRIEGFARVPSVEELAAIAHAHHVPLCVDLGSGVFVDLERFGLPHEPTPREVLSQGADLVTFSGDKLLGSVQAGIVAGREDLLRRIKRNPLRRALRCDKVRIAMLRHSLTLYADSTRWIEEVPLMRMLSTTLDELGYRAQRVADVLAKRLGTSYAVSVQPSECQVGSGALPQTTLPSRAVRIAAGADRDVVALAHRLRTMSQPVIGRVHDGALLLDVRALVDPDALIALLGSFEPE